MYQKVSKNFKIWIEHKNIDINKKKDEKQNEVANDMLIAFELLDKFKQDKNFI